MFVFFRACHGALRISPVLSHPFPTRCSSDRLSREIERCRCMPAAPFGLNLSFLPSLRPPPYAEYAQAIIEGGVRIVETAGRNPAPYIDRTSTRLNTSR